MNRVFLLITAWLVWSTNYAQNIESERIINYEVSITLDTSTRLTVTEKLKVNVKGDRIKRGIFRSLPSRRDINGQNIYVKYDVSDVRKNGKKEEYHTKRENGNYVIYIGDKDVLLEPGIYDYEITYDTYRQIGFFENFDELYWNATGNDWVFPIDKVTATFNLPAPAGILQSACYTGSAGSTDQNCNTVKTSLQTISWTTENLDPNQGLTVAAGFTKGVVEEPQIPAIIQPGNLSKTLVAIGAVLLGLMVFLWKKYGQDHIKPTVFPQFDVQDNLSPASLGYLHWGSYRQNMIASSLINLAVKGFIEINEPKKKGLFSKSKFTITKLKAADESLPPEEKVLMKELIQDKVTIDGEYSSRISEAVRNYTTGLATENMPKLRKGSNWNKVLWIFLGISAVYWSLLVYSHYIFYDVFKFGVGIALYVGAFIVCLILIAVNVKTSKFIWLLPVLFATIVGLWYFKSENKIDAFALAYIFLAGSMVLLAFFNYFVRQPSPELLAKQSRIDGFKMYLEAAENELIKFHNPPQITPEIFEKYLPYALVLGVDGIWGKKFEKSIHANSYQNHWYIGSTSGFSSGMTNSLSRSLSGTISSSSISPSSSGSGGGGSSGGGGGGGGGGGW